MIILDYVRKWQPFSLDAVGLVTLLGANSLQKCLGRLVQHPWAECLPLMAAHIIPDDLICEPVPGFFLYNITDSIKVDGVNAWFSRWLLSQELSRNSTVIRIETGKWRKQIDMREIVSGALGFLVHAFLIVFAALIGDWYALAACITLAISTLTRVLVLTMCRQTLDRSVAGGVKMSTDEVKVLVTMPTNQKVTIYAARGVVINCLIAETRPGNHHYYSILRMLGWAAFGVFIITLGMSCLAMQMMIPIIMIFSTLIIIRRVGCDERIVGKALRLEAATPPGTESHMRTYLALHLSEQEEDIMAQWHLMPLKTNTRWWEQYHYYQKQYETDESMLHKMAGHAAARYNSGDVGVDGETKDTV